MSGHETILASLSRCHGNACYLSNRHQTCLVTQMAITSPTPLVALQLINWPIQLTAYAICMWSGRRRQFRFQGTTQDIANGFDLYNGRL